VFIPNTTKPQKKSPFQPANNSINIPSCATFSVGNRFAGEGVIFSNWSINIFWQETTNKYTKLWNSMIIIIFLLVHISYVFVRSIFSQFFPSLFPFCSCFLFHIRVKACVCVCEAQSTRHSVCPHLLLSDLGGTWQLESNTSLFQLAANGLLSERELENKPRMSQTRTPKHTFLSPSVCVCVWISGGIWTCLKHVLESNQ